LLYIYTGNARNEFAMDEDKLKEYLANVERNLLEYLTVFSQRLDRFKFKVDVVERENKIIKKENTDLKKANKLLQKQLRKQAALMQMQQRELELLKYS